MLPAGHRMRQSGDFSQTVRRGSKGRSRSVMVHLTTHEGAGRPTLVGFVVPKNVGNAVRRNLVKRRLRALMADQVAVLPAGARVVVRALPGSADHDFTTLRTDLDRAMDSALTRSRTAARGRHAGARV